MSDMDCPPLPPTRMRHRGDKINAKGGVSALCFTKPRAIDMKRATWVMSDDAVTCPKCRALILARHKPANAELNGARTASDVAKEPNLWRCTVCGRIGTVGRCCGEETREPVRAPNVRTQPAPTAAQEHEDERF